MDNKDVVMIPFVAHESAMNRLERANKRLWILLMILISLIMLYFIIPEEVVVEDTNKTQEVNDTDNSNINQSMGE